MTVPVARRRRAPVLAAASFVCLVAALWFIVPAQPSRWTIYGVCAVIYLGVKLIASFLHQARALPSPVSVSSGAIVPTHNEDPVALLGCINALVGEVDHVVIIDDGTTDQASRGVVEFLGARPDVDVIRFEANKGKRIGLRVGALHLRRRYNTEIIVTVDSDTRIAPGSVAAGAAALAADGRIAATTGIVRASNWRANALTRIQDIRYANSFLWERAAYSQVGALLCVCGSFTIWRADVLADLVFRLTRQTFLGSAATYGDDRHLTNLALSDGWRVTLTTAARAETLVPETMGHWLRQQVRWSKSFFRETLWAMKNLPWGWAKALSILEITAWASFSSVLAFSLVWRPVTNGSSALASLFLWLAVMSWARSVRFFGWRSDAPRHERVVSFLLAPCYGLLHVVVLIPLRVFAMARLKDSSWGTRLEVEVAAT